MIYNIIRYKNQNIIYKGVNMICTICKIKDSKLKNAIEEYLDANKGILLNQDRIELINRFPESEDLIDSLTEEVCQMHWNFHQAASYTSSIINGDETPESLTKDINKDEAGVLYEFMNKQAATFNCLSNKINGVLQKSDDLTCAVINPSVLALYKDLGDSLRATVREIRELNAQVNGTKSGALEGLKALAQALTPATSAPQMTTTEYDY